MERTSKWAESGREGVQLPPLTSAATLGVSIPQLPQFSALAGKTAIDIVSGRYGCL